MIINSNDRSYLITEIRPSESSERLVVPIACKACTIFCGLSTLAAGAAIIYVSIITDPTERNGLQPHLARECIGIILGLGVAISGIGCAFFACNEWKTR